MLSVFLGILVIVLMFFSWAFAEEKRRELAMICGFTAIALAILDGAFIGYDALIKRAVKEGAAEYYLDSDSERQWRWSKRG